MKPPDFVVKSLEKIRQSGETNMFDVPAVMTLVRKENARSYTWLKKQKMGDIVKIIVAGGKNAESDY